MMPETVLEVEPDADDRTVHDERPLDAKSYDMSDLSPFVQSLTGGRRPAQPQIVT
jgi:hypothetical protein